MAGPALLGAGLAVLALVLVVFALGPVLVRVSPGCSGSARRSCGRPAMQAQHDEAAIFEEEVTPGRLLAQQLQQFTLPLTTVVLPPCLSHLHEDGAVVNGQANW